MSEENNRKYDENTISPYHDENGKFKEGNPGKPKGTRHITTLVMEYLKKQGETKEGKKINYETAFIEAIINQAIFQQNPKMIQLIWNYLDGMPNQNINLNNMDDIRKDYFSKLDDIIKGNNQGDSSDNIQK